jgi:hypothetical protein
VAPGKSAQNSEVHTPEERAARKKARKEAKKNAKVNNK